MRDNVPVTGVEVDYPENINILSITCPKGSIRYVNEDFRKVSGFAEDELIGKNHNVVRHPDMPKAAFADLWGSIQREKAWMGIVKNRCKNGNYYWVNAYVSPIIRDGRIVEYQSVRRKPSRAQVGRAQGLYDQLNAGKSPGCLRDGIGLQGRLLLFWGLLLSAALAGGWAAGFYSLVQLLPLLVVLLVGLLGTLMLMQPYQKLVGRAQKIADNPVARHVYTGRRDDLGWVDLALQRLESDTAGIVGRISDASRQLLNDTQGVAAEAEQTNVEVGRQFAETEQVAEAITRMSASVQEVAGHAGQTVEAAMGASEKADVGIALVDGTVGRLRELCDQILNTASSVQQLADEADGISAIVNTITDIADKTNLLALNAAIEAARAGEQGRGFAVVADEVRELAVRTREATSEIEQMVAGLQHKSQQTVSTMEQGAEYARGTVDQATEANQALSEISGAMHSILEMNRKVASAVEQQSEVADGINRSVTEIRATSEQTMEGAARNRDATGSISAMASELEVLVMQFWSKRSHGPSA
ncbi:MAG: methyl-accepting chemotaxis protein [Marinobacterium sp.]|nr:methyl-accepting chemotaxis protein [Marinobacterium sp.]